MIISFVDMNSLADVSCNSLEFLLLFNIKTVIHVLQLGGIKEGDFIVEINGIDVKWCTHSQVAKFIQDSSVSLELKIITPMDRNYLKVR